MRALGTARAASWLGLSVVVVTAGVLVVRASTCAGGPETAAPQRATSESTRAAPAPDDAPWSPGGQGAADAGRAGSAASVVREAAVTSGEQADTPQPPRGQPPEWMAEQYQARMRWRVEYDAALAELRELNQGPHRERDREAIREARRRVVALREREPDYDDGRLLQREEERRARRRWQVEHRTELAALQRELSEARRAGDDAAAERTRERIAELRAMEPGAP